MLKNLDTNALHAWRTYAAAALGGIMAQAEWSSDETDDDVNPILEVIPDPREIIELAALLADGMLDEERARR